MYLLCTDEGEEVSLVYARLEVRNTLKLFNLTRLIVMTYKFDVGKNKEVKFISRLQCEISRRDIHCVQKKNTHLHFLSYLHE